MSACAVCVQDLYAEALDEYKEAVASLQASLKGLNIPENKWPQEIRSTVTNGEPQQKNVVYDAFAEMERKLKAKREAEAQSGG
jgi:hypothetical protein